jgi:predicted kinase
MFHRVSKPLKSKSFFLFGARGVGKSTFISNYFNEDQTLVFDLLDPELEDQFILD